MRRSRVPWLLLALLALTLGWLGQRRLTPAPPAALTGESDAGARWLRAWAEPERDDAQLVLDGQRDGRLPHAWLPSPGRSARLHVASSAAHTLAGVIVSWAGTPSAGAQLHVGTHSSPLTAADGDDESVLWLATPSAAAELELELPSVAPGTSVAELALLPADAPLWLLSPRARADWDLELLATYGATSVARLPIGTSLPPALAGAHTLVVSNVELPAQIAQQLRRLVEAGATLVELGPRPAVCGPAATSEDSAGGGFVLDGGGANGARWFDSLADVAACPDDDRSCNATRTIVSARRSAGDATRWPLAVQRALGAGQCLRWLGDLASAVRSLRQGDPQRVAKHTSADGPFKPSELFVGRLATADLDVPSADRLGFVLTGQLGTGRGLELLVAPLPMAAPALLVLTADQDFVPAAGELAHSAAVGRAGFTLTLTAADVGGKPDVVYPEAKQPMLALEDVQALAARGHSVGIHPNLVGVSPEDYGRVLSAHAQRFRELYGAPVRIIRNHHLIWSGYVDMAELMARAGLRLDLDYVSMHRSGSIPPGFMTGSGLPMRFVDEQGRLLPIYQQATQLDDSSLITDDDERLRGAVAHLQARLHALLEIAAREHVPITVLHHSHWWFRDGGKFQADLLAKARELGIPVWGAAEWLRFTEARRQTVIRTQGRGFAVDTQADTISLLVAAAHSVHVNGQLRALQAIELAGVRYGLLPLAHGHFVIEP